jgi:protein SCO1
MNQRRMLLKALGGLATPALVLSPCVAGASLAAQPAPTRARYFPNAVLTTHEGKRVRFYDDLIKDKIVVINMIYTACTESCPPDTQSLVQLQEALGERVGRDIFMYSLTLLPETDTPQVLRDYVKRYDIKAGWFFLTGKAADIDLIRRKLGFYSKRADEDADLAQHSGMLRIGNDRFDRWCMAPTQTSTRQLVNTILNV